MPRRRKAATAAGAVLALVGLAVLFAVFGRPAPARTYHPWGRPASDDTSCLLLKYRAFECCYSPRLKLSRWVAYRYYRTDSTGLDRRDWFMPDTFRLRPEQSARCEDYDTTYRTDRSGFDRGHLAPDASIKAFGAQAQVETYFLTNVTPHYTGVNRAIWQGLEGRTRSWAGDRDTVWVVTGPVFFGSRETAWVGTSPVAVPHAYYSVVARGRGPDAVAFVLPNEPVTHTTGELPAFLVSVDSVEALAGLDLFPRLGRSRQQQVEAAPAAALWP
ncbi:DNA/RNA non-specific endonuclease [candidate division WOR-3 bacterium]|nr:DNA/RNA non-specific endonuclease [candidate division WOR-3 bacterium]